MTDMETRLDQVVEEAIAANRIVGTVVLVARHGKTIYHRAAGLVDRESGRGMKEDVIFRFASLTKPLVSAAVLALIERRVLDLDQRATDWLADFRPRLLDGYTPDITIRHLLTHTAGLGSATGEPNDPYQNAGITNRSGEPGLTMNEFLRRIVTVPLFFEPGSAWRYSVATDVLGAIITKARGGTLGEAIAELVTGPLAMPDTAFTVADTSRLAAAYADGVSGPVLMGDPHVVAVGPGKGMVFSPSRIFQTTSFQSGATGMAGTAPDFLRFLEAIRTGGAPILSQETVDNALQNHVGTLRESETPGNGFGYLSAIITGEQPAEAPYPIGTARWGGIYGHNWFVDRQAGLSVVSLTNTALEGSRGRYPNDITKAVYG